MSIQDRILPGRCLALPVLLMALAIGISPSRAVRQPPSIKIGEVVPRDVREIYDRGLQYLVSTQNDAGDWKGGGEQGPGVTGMALDGAVGFRRRPQFWHL